MSCKLLLVVGGCTAGPAVIPKAKACAPIYHTCMYNEGGRGGGGLHLFEVTGCSSELLLHHSCCSCAGWGQVVFSS